MMQLQAKTYTNGAEMVAHYNAIGKRLRGPARRKAAIVTLRPEPAPRPPMWSRRDISFDAHVDDWISWLEMRNAMTPAQFVRSQAKAEGLTYEELRASTHFKLYYEQRKAVLLKTAAAYPHLSSSQLGKLFNRHWTTILHHLGKTAASKLRKGAI
ncbi:hypothetical protein G6L12_08315 [Agrobacterium rhizogenes]|nr:hypothetical protein [Rhizobium rhizogenes]NTF74477.1 hypothetical protein [Rhizobium rhizogenes]